MHKTANTASDALNEVNGARVKAIGLKWWRRLIQVAFLATIGQWSFYSIFRCPFIVPYVSCRYCPVITCHGRLVTMFWGFWLLIPLSAVFFGRSFCGWACPAGLINQIFGKTALFKLRVRSAFTRRSGGFKYLGLGLALIVWLLWGQPREAVPIRIGNFITSVALTFEHANLIWLIRTFFVLGFLASGLMAANAWCRFACPTGGFLEMLTSLSVFKVYKNEKCNDCDQCLKICEMGTRPAESNCTNCCDCLSLCPQDAIKVGHPRRK